MKEILLTLGLVLFAATTYSQTNPFKIEAHQSQHTACPALLIPGKAPLMKHGYAIRSNWNGMAWKDYARYTFTYDAQGRTISETAENLDRTQTQYYTFSRREYSYDDLGRLVGSTLSAGPTVEAMVKIGFSEIFYDDVLNDVVVEQNSYDMLDDGTPAFNSDSYKQIIQRDEAGNITAMNAFTWYDGDFLEVQGFEITYGADGMPQTIVESVATQTSEGGPIELVVSETYSNCTWFECDGQFITLDDITVGNNRLKSADVATSEQGGIKMSVEYPGGDFDWISTMEYMAFTQFPTKSVQSYKDFGGGSYYSRTIVDQDLTAAGAYPVQSVQQILVRYDDFGHLLEAQDQTFYGHTIYNSWKKGLVEVDGDTGLPVRYTQSTYHLQEGNDYYGSWADDYRITYGDWVDVSGIETTAVSNTSTAETEYFDLTGRKVINPSNGIFIRRHGVKTDKIILK